MSEYARGQHPNSAKNYFTKGHKSNQKERALLDKRVMVRLTQEQFEKLEVMSRSQGLPKADFIRKLLDGLPYPPVDK